MTASKVQRRLVCPRCGRRWQVDVNTYEGCPNCGDVGEPFCACGCGASLAEMKRTAVYASEACSKRLSRAPRPDIDPTVIRTETGTDRNWQDAAEMAILDCFARHRHDPEYRFHSDDLWHLIPDDHRGVISLAVMALVNKKLMVGCGYRKSVIPSRKRSPSQEYRLTKLGRDRIVGVGVACGAEEPQSRALRNPHPGESRSNQPASGAGAPTAQAEAGALLPSVPPSASTATPEEPEQIGLLPEPGRYQDPDQQRAA